MLIVISPAKNQDSSQKLASDLITTPHFTSEIITLISKLKTLAPAELASLMHISPKLAELNYQRYQEFASQNFNRQNSYPALGLFNGDVYKSLAASSLTEPELTWAQDHLLILSGLYGALRPLDLIQPYRLEMKTNLDLGGHGNNLYKFWGLKIAKYLNHLLTNSMSQTIINLASQEYSRAALLPEASDNIVNIDFKEQRQDSYRTIGVMAKRARGLMAQWIITKQINNPADIKLFAQDNYQYNPKLSSANNWVFTR